MGRRAPRVRRGDSSSDQKKKSSALEDLEGSIERWFAPRGYGFIEIAGKGDVFVHVNDIVGLSSADALNYSIWGHSLQGSKVRFSVVETVRGYKAKNVEITERPNNEGAAPEKRDMSWVPEGHAGPIIPLNILPSDTEEKNKAGMYVSSHPLPPQILENHDRFGASTVVFPQWVSEHTGLMQTPPGSLAGFRFLRGLPPHGRGEISPHSVSPSTSPPLPCPEDQKPRPRMGTSRKIIDAYSNMCRDELTQCIPHDIHFYKHIVDQIIEFAGSISLSLINFNNAKPLHDLLPSMRGPPLTTLPYGCR